MEFIKYLVNKVTKDFPGLIVGLIVTIGLFILFGAIGVLVDLNLLLLKWAAQYIDIAVYDSSVAVLTLLELLTIPVVIYVRNSFKQFKTEKMHRQMFSAFISGKKKGEQK